MVRACTVVLRKSLAVRKLQRKDRSFASCEGGPKRRQLGAKSGEELLCWQIWYKVGEQKDPKRPENSSADKQGGEGAKKGRGRNTKGRKGLCAEVGSSTKERKWVK